MQNDQPTSFTQQADPTQAMLALQLMQKQQPDVNIYQPKSQGSSGGGGLFGLGGMLPGLLAGGGGGLPGMSGGGSASGGGGGNALISKGLPIAGTALGGLLGGWWNEGAGTPIGAAIGNMAGTYLAGQMQK